MFFIALACYAYSAYALVRSVLDLLFGDFFRRTTGSTEGGKALGYFVKAIVAVLLATLFALSEM